MNKELYEIKRVTAREILDSRANPTVEASVYLVDGTVGRASVPSGASTGKYEAHELRDGAKERYRGLGVHSAMQRIHEIISPVIEGKFACEQAAIDHALIDLDGTENKERLGANATLAVSLATARAAAKVSGQELYRYLGGVNARRLPVPMLNVVNGGRHAENNLDIQEFMIVPSGIGALTEAVRAASEIYHTLRDILRKRALSTAVGDEGGFAPDLKSDEQAIELICEAIERAGYGTDKVKIALDAAASEWWTDGGYLMPKRGKKTDCEGLIKYYSELVSRYPIISIEDGLGEDDRNGWKMLTSELSDRVRLVGDDLFVTNEKRLSDGIKAGLANAILIKPNQIGTLTETQSVVMRARESGYGFIISHRSGETEDSFIADLAVSLGAPFIKTGAPARCDRTAKYNRLMHIEKMLGCGAVYR